MTQRSDLTFKHNLKQGRHGWLRLTPAYSVKVVRAILERLEAPGRILDPFSGTGTTGLVCAERGLDCDLIELNPFLAWFSASKVRNYTPTQIAAARQLARQIVADATGFDSGERLWVPAMHRIERWWSPERLSIFSQIFHAIHRAREHAPESTIDLLLVAFCRVLIDWSNAAFNHQSMSFKRSLPTLFEASEQTLILEAFAAQAHAVTEAAQTPVPGQVRVYCSDSRRVSAVVAGQYDTVITSPPYPNRMSYIRELRPYMYWLGYLSNGREAGELDWQAIGGTWGIATSRLGQWQPDDTAIEHEGFDEMLACIAKSSRLLAIYVHKYFADIARHLQSLTSCLAPGAQVYYIVGNAKFYDTLVPVERIYASLLTQAGFSSVKVESLRKRNSKKELVEFCVQATL